MKRRTRYFILSLNLTAGFGALLLFKGSCAVEPEAGNVCKLQCDTGVKIPSNDMRIRFLSGEGGALSLSCFENAEVDYPLRVPLKFVVEKPRFTLPAENTTGADGTVGGAVPGAEEAAQWVPVSNIGFEPILEAGHAAARGEDNIDEDRYKGILTSETLWCTDSCGIGSIEVKPTCKTGGTNSVVYRVTAGGLSQSIQIDVNQP